MLAAAQSAGSDFERLAAIFPEAPPLDDVRLREWKVWLAFWGAAVDSNLLGTECLNEHWFITMAQAVELSKHGAPSTTPSGHIARSAI